MKDWPTEDELKRVGIAMAQFEKLLRDRPSDWNEVRSGTIGTVIIKEDDGRRSVYEVMMMHGRWLKL